MDEDQQTPPDDGRSRWRSGLTRAVAWGASLTEAATWKSWWRGKRRLILGGIAWGIAIHLVLLCLPGAVTRWVEQRAVDWTIYVLKRQPPVEPNAPAPAFVFIDFDDATLDAWPALPYTPRDKLLSVMRFAVDNQAAAVVVDVNLTSTSGGPQGRWSREDEELATQLRRWAPSQGTSPGCERPLILLNREFRGRRADCRKIRRSFIDELVGDGPRAFAWASAEFELDVDYRVRTWRFSEVACAPEEGGAPSSVPSIQATVAEYLATSNRDGNRCGWDTSRSGQHGGGHQGGLTDRIVYGIQWRSEVGQARAMVPLGNTRVPILTTISAKDITEAAGPLSGDIVRGRVVVIGGSAEGARDIVLTPIGEMPGALVIVNSINSLVRFGRLQHEAAVGETLIALASIVLGSVVMATIRGVWGVTLLGLLMWGMFVPLSAWAIRGGHWIDWALPLCAVALHHAVERVADVFERGFLKRNGRA